MFRYYQFGDVDIAAPVIAGYVGDWNDDVHVGRMMAMWTSPLQS